MTPIRVTAGAAALALLSLAASAAGKDAAAVAPTKAGKTMTEQAFHHGTIADSSAFETLHPRFAKAFAFLRRPDLAQLAPGRYEIDGDNCWATVSVVDLKPFGKIQKAEVHRRYIDIQSPIDGPETYGLRDLKGDRRAFEPFDVEKDYGLADCVTAPLTLPPGSFAIFMPGDGAHAPCLTFGGQTPRRKVVIKVRR